MFNDTVTRTLYCNVLPIRLTCDAVCTPSKKNWSNSNYNYRKVLHDQVENKWTEGRKATGSRRKRLVDFKTKRSQQSAFSIQHNR